MTLHPTRDASGPVQPDPGRNAQAPGIDPSPQGWGLARERCMGSGMGTGAPGGARGSGMSASRAPGLQTAELWGTVRPRLYTVVRILVSGGWAER
jgi:hypothetical protein